MALSKAAISVLFMAPDGAAAAGRDWSSLRSDPTPNGTSSSTRQPQRFVPSRGGGSSVRDQMERRNSVQTPAYGGESQSRQSQRSHRPSMAGSSNQTPPVAQTAFHPLQQVAMPADGYAMPPLGPDGAVPFQPGFDQTSVFWNNRFQQANFMNRAFYQPEQTRWMNGAFADQPDGAVLLMPFGPAQFPVWKNMQSIYWHDAGCLHFYHPNTYHNVPHEGLIPQYPGLEVGVIPSMDSSMSIDEMGNTRWELGDNGANGNANGNSNSRRANNSNTNSNGAQPKPKQRLAPKLSGAQQTARREPHLNQFPVNDRQGEHYQGGNGNVPEILYDDFVCELYCDPVLLVWYPQGLSAADRAADRLPAGNDRMAWMYSRHWIVHGLRVSESNPPTNLMLGTPLNTFTENMVFANKDMNIYNDRPGYMLVPINKVTLPYLKDVKPFGKADDFTMEKFVNAWTEYGEKNQKACYGTCEQCTTARRRQLEMASDIGRPDMVRDEQATSSNISFQEAEKEVETTNRCRSRSVPARERPSM